MNLEKLRNNLYIFLHIIRIKVILGVGHQVDNDKSKSYPYQYRRKRREFFIMKKEKNV